ncbi:MAG TPA: carboxypeptidase regulatory-like domain-containing protein [Malonomonas sp.]
MKLLLVALLLFCSSSPVLAHKVNIFAYVEGGVVYSESYFPDGRPVVEGKVRVIDSHEQLLLEGQTDPAGLFQFEAPDRGDLMLEIDAGMGHKNKFLLKKAASKE